VCETTGGIVGQLVEARMTDISPVSGISGSRVESADIAADRKTQVDSGSTVRPSDRVDISDRARLLSRLASLPPTRTELVDTIRKQIADGTYETADRMDQAVTSLLGDLDIPN
jgi:negative regulator of flagellin synthesis FlgM